MNIYISITPIINKKKHRKTAEKTMKKKPWFFENRGFLTHGFEARWGACFKTIVFIFCVFLGLKIDLNFFFRKPWGFFHVFFSGFYYVFFC